jgi:hypothetical protein
MLPIDASRGKKEEINKIKIDKAKVFLPLLGSILFISDYSDTSCRNFCFDKKNNSGDKF